MTDLRRTLQVWIVIAIGIVAAVAVALGLRARWHRDQLTYRLLADLPNAAGRDPALVRFAASQAAPVFAIRCARCHGMDMRGNPAMGAPDLTDGIWLWGDGSVYDIERIILYGVRAGVSKTRYVNDMPAFGLKGTFHYQGTNGFRGQVVGGPALSSGEAWNLVQYLLKINHRPYLVEAANEGARLSNESRTSCRDCHGPDLKGDSDYGAPDLTVNVWSNGGSPQKLYDSIYYGRQRMMPAGRGVLTLEQVRALAVYIHSVSHRSASR